MEENKNASSDLYKDAARFGVIIGIVGMLLTILLYAIDYTLLADWKVGLFIIALYIGLVIYGGIKYRNKIGGFLSFGQAFQHGYVVLIVAGIVGTIFQIVLYNVIDSELPQKITDVAAENTAIMMKNFGAPEAKIDEAIDKMKVDMPESFGVLGLIKKFGWSILINAVLCLITGAIVKKNQPVEM